MAPHKTYMPVIIKQVSRLKRLHHGPKSTTETLNLINPDEFEISNSVRFILKLVTIQ